MVELGAGADILRSLGWLYVGLIVSCCAAALWLPRRWWQKVACLIVVLLVFIAPAYMRDRDRDEQINARKARYAEAKALFDDRCRSAGEQIERTALTDGIVWLKWRPTQMGSDQFAADDLYGNDCSAEGCIHHLLRGNGSTYPNGARIPGFKFVETIDPRDGVRYRYTGTFRSRRDVPADEFSAHVRRTGSGVELDGTFLSLQRVPVERFGADHGITWDDVSTHEDREHWIAGGVLKILDLRTNEVIAKHLGYVLDPGQGGKGGGRDPWGWARSNGPKCPNAAVTTWDFAFKVLLQSN